MKTFTMFRRNVPDATHNAFQKNASDQAQFEGVVFSDGTVAIRWLTAKRSTAVWASMEDMLAIHGHPEYGSELIWNDVGGDMPVAPTPAILEAIKQAIWKNTWGEQALAAHWYLIRRAAQTQEQHR